MAHCASEHDEEQIVHFYQRVWHGVAIAQCIVGYFAWEYDATFDKVHQHHEQIYRVSSGREFENKTTRFGYAPFPLGEVVARTFSDVNASSRFYESYSNFKLNNDLFPANLNYVDQGFFQMFSFDFVAGNAREAKDKTSVLISESMAVRLFGNAADALGKTITQVYGQELKEVKVTGVFKDPPMNSSFYRMQGSAFMNFENYKDEHKDLREDDWKARNTLFVQINDPSRVNTVVKQLQPFVENNNKVREDFQIREYQMDQLTIMAQLDRAEDTRTETWPAPPISAVIGSGVSGILILLLACFNLTNTSIAISSRRLKEIGIRKVMGSSRKSLVLQYLGETFAICAAALIVGLVLADFMVRGWNYMWEYFRLTPHYLDNPVFLTFLIGVLVFTAIAAGSYPAFYISQFKPVTILKGTQKFGGTNFFTRILLGLQFAISLISIVSAIGFIQNAGYQRAYDLGFDGTGAVIAYLSNQGEFDTYRNALQTNPAIESIAGAHSGIFSNRTTPNLASVYEDHYLCDLAMRRFVGLFFLMLMVLNAVGYYGLLVIAQHQLESHTLQRLEMESAELGGNLVLAIPLEMPYSTQSTAYTPTDGKFRYEGHSYRFVKQKFYQSMVYVVCVMDEQVSADESVVADYSRLLSGADAGKADHGLKLINALSKDFMSRIHDAASCTAGWIMISLYTPWTDFYHFALGNIHLRPPANLS